MKHKLLFTLIMGMITTGMISFVLIAINAGFNGKFLLHWLRSWILSYMLAVSSSLFIAPGVQELVNRLAKKRSKAIKEEGQQ